MTEILSSTRLLRVLFFFIGISLTPRLVAVESEVGFPQLPPTPAHIESMTIVFHGTGADAHYTNLIDKLDRSTPPHVMVYAIDWLQFSKNQFLAAKHGETIGRLIGEQLKDLSLNSLNIIGISVGAFPAHFASKVFKEKGIVNYPEVTLTFLDPFSLRGLFDFNFGVRNFGEGIEGCFHYLNSDDRVPSTNRPLDHCQTIDITHLKPIGIQGHDWPTIYFTSQIHDEST